MLRRLICTLSKSFTPELTHWQNIRYFTNNNTSPPSDEEIKKALVIKIKEVLIDIKN